MSEEKQSIAAFEARINFLESQISSAPIANEYWDWQSVLSEMGETLADGVDPSLFGIVIDNANERVQVLARKVVQQTVNGPSTVFTFVGTYLDLSEGAVGGNTIYFNFDPDAAYGAGTNPEISFSEGSDRSYRLYDIAITEVAAGPPQVLAATLTRVYRPGDVILGVPPPPASGTHVLLSVEGEMDWVAAETMVCTS